MNKYFIYRNLCCCCSFGKCLAEIDECLTDPCNPIGTEECIDFDNKFICKCRTGYSGELCEGKFLVPLELCEWIESKPLISNILNFI